jgi:hypothetical protein
MGGVNTGLVPRIKMLKKRFSHQMNLINEHVGRQGQRGDKHDSVSLRRWDCYHREASFVLSKSQLHARE